MRISYDLGDSEESGKHKFMSRLRKELPKFNCHECKPDENPDIHLFTRQWSPAAKRNVYRIDGIGVNIKIDYQYANLNVVDKLQCSTGVVFQNQFCKDVVDSILGKKTYCVNDCIFNGADPKEFDVQPLKADKPYFMALCKWRPYKRLDNIIEGFLTSKLKDVDLLVFGKTDQSINHPQIKYMGWQPKQVIARAIKGSVSTVHLAWLDWCPNSVVESLMSGKQVVHTDSGGTPLLVQRHGFPVKDHAWDYKVHDVHDSPKLDIEEVGRAYRLAYEFPIVFDPPENLNISFVARSYVEFFKKVLSVDGTLEKDNQRSVELRKLDAKRANSPKWVKVGSEWVRQSTKKPKDVK